MKMIPLTSDSDSLNFLPLNLNSMSPASKGITLLQSFTSDTGSWRLLEGGSVSCGSCGMLLGNKQ